jgi:hypothetical protein|tara:strand:- start:322 stop:627 length:306 start_codon:yes stop_codon:yes gene_type:complete
MNEKIDLYGTLLEKQDEIITLSKNLFKNAKEFNKVLDEKVKITEELNWYRKYGNYIGKVYSNVDAEACGYADGDKEYKENMKKTKLGFYEINSLGIDSKIN